MLSTPNNRNRYRRPAVFATVLVAAFVVSVAASATISAASTIAVLAAWLGIAIGVAILLAASCGDAVSLERAPPSPAHPVWPWRHGVPHPVWPERHGATFDAPLEPEAIVRVPDHVQELADWKQTRDCMANAVEYLTRLASVHRSEPVSATDMARAAVRLLESPRFRAELEARSIRVRPARLPSEGVMA